MWFVCMGLSKWHLVKLAISVFSWIFKAEACNHYCWNTSLIKIIYLKSSSAGKESTFYAGDPSWIPGLERFPGEGIGDPVQYSWASLVAQLVKNPPAMWETWVQFLGWEDPLEKGKATHFSILAWRMLQRVRHNWATFTFTLGINAFLRFFRLVLSFKWVFRSKKKMYMFTCIK